MECVQERCECASDWSSRKNERRSKGVGGQTSLKVNSNDATKNKVSIARIKTITKVNVCCCELFVVPDNASR